MRCTLCSTRLHSTCNYPRPVMTHALQNLLRFAFCHLSFQIKTEEATYFKWEGGPDRKRCKPTVKTLTVTSLFLDNLYIFLLSYISYYHFSYFHYISTVLVLPDFLLTFTCASAIFYSNSSRICTA